MVLCAFICVWVCVRQHVCVHECKCVCRWMCTCIYLCAWTDVYVPLCISMHLRVNIFFCTLCMLYHCAVYSVSRFWKYSSLVSSHWYSVSFDLSLIHLTFFRLCSGLFCIAPYFALLLSTYGFGEFFRHLQMNHNWATRTVRQTAQLISFLGSGICLFICAFVNSKGTGLTMMILAQVKYWLIFLVIVRYLIAP